MEIKLGFLKPEAFAAGIVWFIIIVSLSPFFGYEYVRQDDYVTVQRYEEMQHEAEYWEEEYAGAIDTIEEYENELQYYRDILDEHNISW